jgi:uncharacterized membrane protein YbhN (UPF0104 family)
MEKTAGRSIYKRLLPWVTAVLILIFLFRRIDMDQFFNALGHADIHIYMPLMTVFILIWFFVDSQNLTALLKHFGHRVSYVEVLAIRGLTYLLMVINYNLGVGGIALYLRQDKGIPFVRSTSLMLFYLFVDTVSLTFMAAMGAFFSLEQSIFLNRVGWVCMIVCLACIIGAFIFRFLPQKSVFQKVKNMALFETFKDAGLKSYMVLPLWRGLYFATFILYFYLALKAFHVHISIFTIASYVPVIFFIGNLPVTPFGLGTIQAAMLFFFRQYSSEANILAFSITYSTTLILFRIPIGLFYLKKITQRDLKASN